MADDKKREVPMSEFQTREWKVSKEKEIVQIHAGVQQPHDADQYHMNMIRSVGFLALHEAQAAQIGSISSRRRALKSLITLQRVAYTLHLNHSGSILLQLQNAQMDVNHIRTTGFSWVRALSRTKITMYLQLVSHPLFPRISRSACKHLFGQSMSYIRSLELTVH